MGEKTKGVKMIAGERIEAGDFVDIFVDKKTGKSIVYKIKPPKICDETFYSWVKEQIEKLEKEGKKIVSVNISFGDGFDSIHLPYPQPKTEREKICDELISYISPLQNTTIKYNANQIVNWIRLIRDIKKERGLKC